MVANGRDGLSDSDGDGVDKTRSRRGQGIGNA